MQKICFLCGEKIEGKMSKEHIIGDAFLGSLELKNQKFKFNSGEEEKEYSRLKVPSHFECNNEFGARFETEILQIIDDFGEQQDKLKSMHLMEVNDDVREFKAKLVKWLAKLYLGFVYWESSLANHSQKDYQTSIKLKLEDPLLKSLQKSLMSEEGMHIPSSLFYFSVPGLKDDNFKFDFATGLPLGLFYLKFNEHLLVLALGDANLVSQYYEDELYRSSQVFINEKCDTESCAYLHPVSHIWTVRELLPIEPNLQFFDDYILDISRREYGVKPDIDEKAVNQRAAEIYTEHASR